MSVETLSPLQDAEVRLGRATLEARTIAESMAGLAPDLHADLAQFAAAIVDAENRLALLLAARRRGAAAGGAG